MKNIINEIKKIIIPNFEISNGTQQRSIGDLIEYKLNQKIKELCEDEKYTFNDDVGKKATGDCVIYINNEITLYVDCKTHNKDAKMSMPNLISMKKLFNLLDEKNENLIYVICEYRITENMVEDIKIKVINLFDLDEQYLGIGNLGNGQLQIKNLNNENSLDETSATKEKFHVTMLKKYIVFLDKQIEKYIKTKNKYQQKLDELTNDM